MKKLSAILFALCLGTSGAAWADGYSNPPSSATNFQGTLAPTNGGTGANLSATGGTSQFLKQATVGGNLTPVRPTCADLSNAATSCSTDATNASNISSGTLADARLPLGLYAYTVNVNFNAGNTDTAIVLNPPAGATRFKLTAVHLSHASQSLTTATAGLFTATAGGGAVIVAAGSAITVSTASENTANNAQSMTVANGASASYLPSGFATANTLYWRVATAQGSAATGDVTVYVYWLP